MLVALAALLAAPGVAAAKSQTDNDGSKWYSGNIQSQWGQNCSTAIIGEPYSEIMVQSYVSYGGLPDVPKVGDSYWVSIYVSIPGNPCGSGSSVVATDLYLPPGTDFDFSGGKTIECYGYPRGGGRETLTNQSWSFLGSSGRWCPASPSAGRRSGFYNMGYRPLANGTMFEVVVPVKSTQPLYGAGGPNHSHVFMSEIESTGVYANPMAPEVWANVIDASDPTPRITLGQPATKSTWEPNPDPGCNTPAPNGPPNQVANNYVNFNAYLYRGNQTGRLYLSLYKVGDANPYAEIWGPISNAGYYWSLNNGDGVTLCPFPNDTDLEYRWSFRADNGVTEYATTARLPFHTHPGPDADNDGVPDARDACVDQVGNQSNGCPEAVQEDPDKDGVFGANDKCPQTDGKGTIDGCPAGDRDGDGVPDAGDACPDMFFQTANGCAPPPATTTPSGGQTDPPPATDRDGDGVLDASDACPDVKAASASGCPVTVLSGSFALGAAQRRAGLLKGLKVPLSCSQGTAAVAALKVDKATARKLGLGRRQLKIASGRGACPGSLKLTVAKKLARKLGKVRKRFTATLTVTFAATGRQAVVKSLKLTFT